MKLTTFAFRNIKQNISKYVMYFFSLSFSVFTAYSFLALMQNDYVKLAFRYDDRYKSMLMSFGIIIMVFVMFFLISSNNSFIKARKKEISTYALFGMTNGKIAKLMFLETMIVGIATLVIGIGIGIFFSKLLAMILLDISLASFTGEISFSIDPKAIYLTIAIFMSIFFVMGLSGLRVINKFQLIDLFKAEKVSEGKSKGSMIVLVLSLFLIGTGYFLASQSNPQTVVNSAIPVLILVIVGTYLFFLSGFPRILDIIKRNKSRYFQGVNLISTSALSHRMKTISSVMATIAVLSAVATTAIATGYTLYSNIEKNTYETVGYDMYYYGDEEGVLDTVHAVFKNNKVDITEKASTALYTATPDLEPLVIEGTEFFSNDDYFRIYSQSDYNSLISISKNNLKQVAISHGEALYIFPHSLMSDIDKMLTGHLLSFSKIDVNITSTLRTGFASFGAYHTIVVNDEDFNLLLGSGDIFGRTEGENYQYVNVFNYQKALSSDELNRELKQVLSGNVGSFRMAYDHYIESLETFGLVCFIGFFMSAVFILMTASLLYFKQVMAAEEERDQYRMLRKIGMDSDVEKKVIKKRLLPVFFVPLAVGISHSIFAMKAADTIVFSQMIPVSNSYYTVLSFSAVMYGVYGVIYGVFYYITKAQYSRIVKVK